MCASVTDAMSCAYKEGYFRIYGIGGQRIYEDLLPKADRMMITEVNRKSIPEADTFFPNLEEAKWIRRQGITLRAKGPKCVLREWLIKRPRVSALRRKRVR